MCSTPWSGVAADELHLDAFAWMAERAQRLGQAVGMRAEGYRAQLGRAPAVGRLGVGKEPVHLREELRRRGRRAGDGGGDAS